jgi:branched-subunit amino acid aminotransferase/4-amino-4-deoxychorismate lyase
MVGWRMRVEIDGRPAGAEVLRVLAAYGHFTAMQVRDGRVRGLALHLDRLDAANRELFGCPLDGERVRERVRHALGGDITDASVRVYALGGDEGVSTVVTVRPPGEMPATPQRLSAVVYQRPVAHIKHAAGFAQEYHRRRARLAGFDEILLTGPGGVISEGGVTNVGFLDGAAVVWPDAPALAGITMRVLVAALAARGVPSRRRTVRVADLGSFGTMFVANARGIAAVAQVDGRALPVDEGFVRALGAAYAAVPWDPV